MTEWETFQKCEEGDSRACKEAVATLDLGISVDVLHRQRDCMTETQTIYASFLEVFRSEVDFTKRMVTKASVSYTLSAPSETPERNFSL